MSPIVQIHQILKNDWAPIIGALEFRLMGVRARSDQAGWLANVAAYVRNPEISINNAAGSKDILTRTHYQVRFDAEVALTDFEQVEESS